MDNSAYVDADVVSTVNSIYSLIKSIEVKFNGVSITLDDVNQCLNIKNLLQFTEPYESIASNAFYYPDNLTATNLLPVFRDDTVPHLRTDILNNIGSFSAPNGFIIRHDEIIANTVVHTLVSLNRYGFFESFDTQIAPPGKISLIINFDSSENFIYRAAAAGGGKVVVTKMILHVPQLIFNGPGELLFLNNYLISHEWNYLRERLEVSAASIERQGTFLISSAINQPRHVFIWALNSTKLSDQEQNMFFFNTFDIGDDHRRLINCQLEVGSGNYFPSESLKPYDDPALSYRRLMSFGKHYNDYLTGSQISLSIFKELYPVIYFDLRNRPENLRRGTTKMSFKWQIDAANAQPFSWHAMILHEESIKVVKESNKTFLRD